MKSLFFILCNFVLLGFVFTAAAESESPYFARTWLAEDGLPDNRVVGLAQTSDGYLWVATQGGVVRFDGVRFQRVSVATSPDLIAGTLRVLTLDRAGQIWLAKEEGGTLFCFRGARVQVITDGLPKNETQTSMAVDGDGAVWIAYNTGKLIRYDPDGRLDVMTAKAGLPAGGVCWLATDRDGTLWFARSGHVGTFRNGRFNVLKTFDSLEVRIVAARSGGIWICAGRQVMKLDPGGEAIKLAKINSDDSSGHFSFQPSVLLEDRDGAVWVGTISSGLFRCDSNGVEKVEVSNPAIISLAEDREGDLWVGTRGGLDQLHRRMVSLIKSSDGLPFEEVQSVCQDATGKLWVAGGNGALVRGNGTNWIVQSLSNDLVQPHVTCVAAGMNGSVWIGTWGGGLYRWNNGRFNDIGLRTNLVEKSPRSLLLATNGDLWIATDSSEVLYRLRAGQLQPFALPPGHRFIRAMTEDASGNFWAGASDGLLVRISGDRLVDETGESGLLSIRCLHGAANGDLWIGYAGAGVGRLRDGKITRFSTEQGLPNDYVAQILTDNRGSVWFAGNQGIFQVREQDFDDLSKGLTTRVWPIIYGRGEGLPGLQASFDYYPDSVCSSDNRLYFSMLSGLAEVRPDEARLNYQPPKVFIERVTADGRTFAAYDNFNLSPSTNGVTPMELSNPDHQSELILPPGLQQLQFEFTALSFVSPENVQLRYQLIGLDDNQIDAGAHRIASYTRPPPGHYRFKVIACNNDGIWNMTGDSLSIIIEPCFWETLWFKFIVTLSSFAAFCGVIVWMLRRRHRFVVERLEHQRAVELERTRIARDLHDDLGVGLTEIGLLGDLAGAGGDLQPVGRERVREITDKARTLAASLDEIVWAINPTNDTSQSLMDYFFEYAQKLLGKAGIRCRLEVIEPMASGNLTTEERHEIFYAFKEALNNVIRHSGATEVRISLAAVKGELFISVTDDGCGFAALSEAESSRNGLIGMRERLRRLGGRCEINGASGNGATVTFIFPMQSELPL